MRDTTRDLYEERILRVQMYIQNHLDDPFTLEDLAKVACFSPYHFHRIFRAMVGESLMDYFRRLRLERAALELRHSRWSITTIAFRGGYETHESFTRAFRKRFDRSPREYRKEHRGGKTNLPEEQTFIAIIKRQGGHAMEVKIKTLQPMTVASVRHVGPYKEVCVAWERLCSHPEVFKAAGSDPVCLGICYDDPDITDSEKIRYDACLTVDADFVPGEGVDKQQIEGGRYAILTHKGSYEGLHSCYRWLYGEWLPQSGYDPRSAPSLEIYRNNPETTPPEDLLTDICIPLEERKVKRTGK